MKITNPAWTLYIILYNVMYHDYGMRERAIAARIGPEPDRYMEPDAEAVHQALIDEAQSQAEMRAWEDYVATIAAPWVEDRYKNER